MCVKKLKELHDVKDMLCALPGLCHLPGSLNPSFLAATWEKGYRSTTEVRACVCVCVCVKLAESPKHRGR